MLPVPGSCCPALPCPRPLLASPKPRCPCPPLTAPSRLSCTLWMNGTWLAVPGLSWYNLSCLKGGMAVSKLSLGAEDVLGDRKRLGNLLGPLPTPVAFEPRPQFPSQSNKSGLVWIMFSFCLSPCTANRAGTLVAIQNHQVMSPVHYSAKSLLFLPSCPPVVSCLPPCP